MYTCFVYLFVGSKQTLSLSLLPRLRVGVAMMRGDDGLQDKEVQGVQKLVPYKIVDGQDGAAWVEVQGNKMSPSQVSVCVEEGWGYCKSEKKTL